MSKLFTTTHHTIIYFHATFTQKIHTRTVFTNSHTTSIIYLHAKTQAENSGNKYLILYRFIHHCLHAKIHEENPCNIYFYRFIHHYFYIFVLFLYQDKHNHARIIQQSCKNILYKFKHTNFLTFGNLINI